MFFRCRSPIEKHFSHTEVSTVRKTFGGSMAWPPEKLSKIACSRMSENALLHSRGNVYIVAFHFEVENMILISNLHCTKLKILRTLIFKEEIL